MEYTTPLKAIRAKCLDCSCYQINEIKLCATTKCPLYAYRMGKNPYRAKRALTEEQKAALVERLSQNRPKNQGENANDYQPL